MNRFIGPALTLGLVVAGCECAAQNFPEKPIRWILPYPPGGGAGLIARPIAQKLSAILGQRVVIDERGGANGTLGMMLAAHAPADGYTIIMALTAQVAVNPTLYPELQYDPVRDYSPIILLGGASYLLAVNPTVPVKTVKELIDLAKSSPNKLTFASTGTGGIPHLAFEMLKSMSGIDAIHVPYKGGGPALIDVMGGQVQIVITTVVPVLQYVRSGRLRGIAVTSAKRSRNVPDLPTISESVPGYEASTLYDILAPANTPGAVLTRLNREFSNALAQPEIRAQLLGYDFEPIGGTPGELTKQMKSERTRWAKVIADSGIKAD